MTYSLPYILFIGFILLIAAFQIGVPIEEKTRKYLNILAVVAYVLFFGFRGFIGWDWYSYYPFYKSLKSVNQIVFEPGFIFYTFFIKSLFHSYQSYILINTIIDALLLTIFLKRYLDGRYYAFGLAIFIGFSGIVLETDLLRNMKSFLLFLISIRYIENKQILKYFILNIVALSFHWSAILFFPLYFLLQKRISPNFYLAVIIVGNIVILFNFHYIKPVLFYFAEKIGGTTQDKITAYLSSKLFSKPYELSFGYIIRLFTSLIIYFYYNKIRNYSKSSIIFLNAFFIWIIIFLFFSEVSIAIGRFSILFAFSLCILIPILLKITKPISTRVVLISLYLGLIFIKVHATTNNVLYRYDNSLFGGIHPYEERLDVYKVFYNKLTK